MSATDLTVQDAYDSVTGYDEIAIETRFGIDVHLDQERKPGKWLRALIFVHLIHAGADHKDAHGQAMSMTSGQTSDYFAQPAEGDDDVDVPDHATEGVDEFDDEPADGPGKDVSSPVVEPVASPPSVF